MGGFGDVLRGLGSVLNPQVAQGLEQERVQGQARSAQEQQFMLQQLVKGVESGAIDPAKLPPQLQGMVAPSPEAQAKMEAMKNERAYRTDLGALGPQATEDQMAQLAVKHGKPEVAAAYAKTKEDRAFRIQSAADNLKLKQDTLIQQRDLALERAADQRARDQIGQEFKAQSLALQAQQAGISNEMRRMGLDMQRMGLDIQKDKATQAGTQQTQAQVTKLSAALEKAGLPEADAVLSAVEKNLKDVPDLSKYLTGPASKLPDFAIPDKAKEARQALDKLFNITLKMRSGSAVTQQELDRLKSEFGIGGMKSQVQIENAVKAAREIMTNHYAGIASGYGKPAFDQVNSNREELGLSKNMPVNGKPSAPADTPPPPPGFKVNP